MTLAAEEDRPFRDALDIVHRARPSAMSHPALHEFAVFYLATSATWPPVTPPPDNL